MERRARIIVAIAAGVAVLAVVIAIVFWAARRPAATIEVKTGPLREKAGAVITVTGFNFPANQQIYVGLAAPNVSPGEGTSYAMATSDRDGKFSATFPFPSTPNWTTLPEVTVYAGTPAGETVATARLPLNSFTSLLTPPASATPLPTTTPLAPLPSATSTATASPTPAPTAAPPPTAIPVPAILLQPAAGRVGDTIVVSGRGWRANEALSVYLLGLGTQSSLKVGVAATDATGKFTMAFVLPTDWSGPNLTTVLVRSQDGSEQALAILEVYGLVTPALTPTFTPLAPTPTPLIITGWLGQYYSNPSLGGDPILIRNDDDINFDWGANSPAPGVLPNEHFSARWTRSLYLQRGNYRFSAEADDGVRVWLDGNLIIDEWHTATSATYKYDVNDLNDGMHNFKVEYYQDTGLARIHVWWQQVIPPTVTPTVTGVPTSTTMLMSVTGES